MFLVYGNYFLLTDVTNTPPLSPPHRPHTPARLDPPTYTLNTQAHAHTTKESHPAASGGIVLALLLVLVVAKYTEGGPQLDTESVWGLKFGIFRALMHVGGITLC